MQSISNPIFSSQNFKLQNINELPKYEDLTHSSIPQPQQESTPVVIQSNYPNDSNESFNENNFQMNEIDLRSDELEEQPVNVDHVSNVPVSIVANAERAAEQIHSVETSKV